MQKYKKTDISMSQEEKSFTRFSFFITLIHAQTHTTTHLLTFFRGIIGGRRYLGIEREQEFANISRKRREEINNFKIYGEYRSKIKDIARSEIYEPNCFVCEEETFVYLPF